MAIHSRWRLRAGQAGVRFPAANSVRAGDNEAMAMTEQEWLACENPLPMLEFLRGKAGDRKLRLFAVACCRRIWALIEPNARLVVEAAEEATDKSAGEKEFLELGKRLPGFISDYGMRAARSTGERIARLAANHTARNAKIAAGAAAWEAAEKVHDGPVKLLVKARNDAWAVERRSQAGLLRDIFGNPFRPVTMNPAWRTSNSTALAQSIYDERAFDRMPILADALEDAGCDNQDVLQHCRGGGEHVRGCWVVDLVLGRE
jgi:hypothetical protein